MPAAMTEAVLTGNMPVLEHLLAVAPGLAAGIGPLDERPLVVSLITGQEEAMRLLLKAAPESALLPNSHGSLPLHLAVDAGMEGAVRLLLEAAPAAALVADGLGWLPLHCAARRDSQAIVRLLLEAAPASASRAAEPDGWHPLHVAAAFGRPETVQLLLEAAPASASTRAGLPPLLPFAFALMAAEILNDATAPGIYSARVLLPATPPEYAVTALAFAGRHSSEPGNVNPALPLFSDLVGSHALSPDQWQHVPTPCPGLGAALPTVLRRSEAEARLLVGHLAGEEQERLRTAALSLARVQRQAGVELPAGLVGRVLALAATP